MLGIAATAEYTLRQGGSAGVDVFSLAAIGLLAGAYLLNRTGHFRTALAIALGTLTLGVYGLMIQDPGETGSWLYLILPLLVAEFFLPLPGYAVAAAGIVAGTLVILERRANIDFVVYVFFVASVLGVSSYFKAQLERRRRLALRESEERGARLMDSARDVIVTTDVEGRITSLSPSFENFTGWPRARWLGRSYEELVTDEDRANAAAQFARVLHGETLRSLRMRIRTRPGGHIVVEMNVSPWLVDGRPEGLLGIARDMTSEVAAEEALQASEARLGALTAATTEAVIFQEAGHILDVNPAAVAIFGYSSTADIVGRNLMDFVAPESRALVLQQVRSGSTRPYEAQGLRKDGTTFPVEATGRSVEYAGRTVRVTSIHDITERKQAGRALRESQERLRLFFDQSLDGFFFSTLDEPVEWNERVDRDAVIEYVLDHQHITEINEAMAAQYGSTRERMLGRTPRDFFRHDVEQARNLRRRIFDAGRLKLETEERKDDGTPVWFEAHYVRMDTADGRIAGVFGIQRDISDRKQHEAALRASEAKFSTLFQKAAFAAALWRLSDGIILDVNQAFERIFGYPRAEAIGKTTEELQIRPDAATREQAVAALESSGSVYNLEMTLRTKAAEMRTFVLNLDHVEIDGERCILSTAQDITERRRAEQELERRASELASLLASTHELVVEQNLPALLQTIVRRAVGLLGATGGALYLSDSKRKQVECVVSYRTLQDYAGVVLKYGEGAAGDVAQSGQPLIIDDYRTWKRRAAVYDEDAPFVSVLAVPLRWEDEILGVLVALEDTERRAFSEADQRLLSLYADHAAIAVRNARLFETEQKLRRQAAALADVGRGISATLQLDVVMNRVAAYARELLQSDTSGVYIAAGDGQTLRPISAIGPDSQPLMAHTVVRGTGILGGIAVTKQGAIVNDASDDPRALTVRGTEKQRFEHLMCVPLVSKDEVIGLVAVWRTGAGREFEAVDLEFLTGLAAQASVAVANASLFEEVQKRLREIEALYTASSAAGGTLELEPMLGDVLRTAIEAIPAADRGSVLFPDEAGYLCVRAVWGYQDPRVREVKFPPTRGYAAAAFRENRALIVEDARTDPAIRYEGDIPEILSIGSALAVPLVVKDQVIGVLTIDSPRRRSAFTPTDLRLLETMAASAALAIENARLFEATRKRLVYLEILQTISSHLRSAATLDEALPIILDQLIGLLPAEGALLELLEAGSGAVVSTLGRGRWAAVTGTRWPPGEGVSPGVIATGEPYVTNSISTDGLVTLPDLVGGLECAACVPILARNEGIGTLWVGRHTPITPEEVALLRALGEMVGNTVQRMQLHQKTLDLIDDLRGAYSDLEQAYDSTLEGWAKALELRDQETEGHSRRVTELTVRLASRMGLPEGALLDVRRGALLHDIGKMGVPDEILRKPGPLNPAEWEAMRKHPVYAHDLLSPIEHLRGALEIPYHHHERWDGSGYPGGLSGDQIPLAARVFAVVDVWDALQSERPYRPSWSAEKAEEHLRENAGKLFDPRVVDAFLEMVKQPGAEL